MAAKGWWRVSLKLETLGRLESIRDRLLTSGEMHVDKDGKKPSYEAVVSHIITAYFGSVETLLSKTGHP